MHNSVQKLIEWRQSLLLSWQSGRFQIQRSAVRIQSSANFYNERILLLTGEKTKSKRGRELPTLKTQTKCENVSLS